MLLTPERPRLVATSVQALLQPVPDHEALARQTRMLRLGQRLSLEELARWLVENRFHPTTGVEFRANSRSAAASSISLPPTGTTRYGSSFRAIEIESIRRFEVSSQRSMESLEGVEVTVLEPLLAGRGHFADFLPPESWFLLVEPGRAGRRGEALPERLERPQELHAVADVLRQAFRFPSVTAFAVAAGSLETTCRLKIESVERFSGDINKVRDELDDAGAGRRSPDLPDRGRGPATGRTLRRHAAGARGASPLSRGRCTGGFRLVTEGVVLLSSGESFYGGPICGVQRAAASGKGDRQFPGTARGRSGHPRPPMASPATAD